MTGLFTLRLLDQLLSETESPVPDLLSLNVGGLPLGHSVPQNSTPCPR